MYKRQAASGGWLTVDADVSKEVAAGGKHYFEMLLEDSGGSARGWFGLAGIAADATVDLGGSDNPFSSTGLGFDNNAIVFYNQNGGITNYVGPPNTEAEDGDVLGILLDFDNQTIAFSVNGAIAGTSDISGETATHYRPALSMFKTKATFRFAAEDLQHMPAGYTACLLYTSPSPRD